MKSVYLYDDITPDSARAMAAALLEDPDSDIELHINSSGGNVTDGYAIASALKTHKGKKTAIIDGLCASAATFPACACDAIHMYPESLFMVHGPWAEAMGGIEKMAEQGELLGKMSDLCLAMYQRKTGADEATVREWMARDTWMTPAEAMEAGFCNKVLSDAAPPQAKASAQRFMAKLRMPKNTNKGQVKMALSEDLKNKLAKYGLGDDESPEALQKAFQAFMMDEDDPEMRKQMRAAVADCGGDPKNPPVTADADKDKDEDSSSDKSASMRAKLNQNAHADPAVQKLLGKLTSRTSEMENELAELRREKQVAAFAKAMSTRVDEETAREFLTATGFDEAKAKVLVMKLPEKDKSTAMNRMTRGGAPIGANPNAGPTESEAAPIVNNGRHQLHGYAFSKIAAARADKETAPNSFWKLAAAQKAVLRERPDTYR